MTLDEVGLLLLVKTNNQLLSNFEGWILKAHSCRYKNLAIHSSLHKKVSRIVTPFTFWDMRTWDLRNVCLQTCRSNRIHQKVHYFLRKIQTLWANNSRIIRIQNAKCPRYQFYMNTNIWKNFQICISVPLRNIKQLEGRGISQVVLKKSCQVVLW